MTNPFDNRATSLSGPARDLLPITPTDGVDLSKVCIGLYIEGGGTLAVTTVAGEARTISVPDYTMLPVGITRVSQTGTTATGISGLVVS